jgi:hypothetical protein
MSYWEIVAESAIGVIGAWNGRARHVVIVGSQWRARDGSAKTEPFDTSSLVTGRKGKAVVVLISIV